MGKKQLQFVAGVLTGALIFGGGTALAAGLIAEPSEQRFYLGDRQVELEAYSINDYNYVKLRDVGRLVGFDVSYDAARDAAIIDTTKPYTDDEVSEQDYAADANPDIFGGELTREVFCAMRHAVLNRDAIADGKVEPKPIVGVTEFGAAYEAAGAIGGYPIYELLPADDGGYVCTVRRPEAYAAAIAHTQPFVDSLSGIAQEEQVREVAWYVCDRMTYRPSFASPTVILASDEVSAGSCMSYAYSFRVLCDRVGIPCLLVQSETHQWNKVYVSGRWWDVDLTALDTADDTSGRDSKTVLCDPSEMYGEIYEQLSPKIAEFAQELLVPGSTK